jgi:hypothetical protein
MATFIVRNFSMLRGRLRVAHADNFSRLVMEQVKRIGQKG